MNDMKKIIKARNKYGTSLTALAHGIGRSRGFISRVFNGKQDPGEETIKKMKKFFNITGGGK